MVDMDVIICRDYEETQSHKCVEKDVSIFDIFNFVFIFSFIFFLIFSCSFIYYRIKTERTDLKELRKIYKEVDFKLE